MKTNTKIPLIGAAGLGLFALSACSSDEISAEELSGVLDDWTVAEDATCDEDFPLSEGESTECGYTIPDSSDGDRVVTVTYNENRHSLDVEQTSSNPE